MHSHSLQSIPFHLIPFDEAFISKLEFRSIMLFLFCYITCYPCTPQHSTQLMNLYVQLYNSEGLYRKDNLNIYKVFRRTSFCLLHLDSFSEGMRGREVRWGELMSVSVSYQWLNKCLYVYIDSTLYLLTHQCTFYLRFCLFVWLNELLSMNSSKSNPFNIITMYWNCMCICVCVDN